MGKKGFCRESFIITFAIVGTLVIGVLSMVLLVGSINGMSIQSPIATGVVAVKEGLRQETAQPATDEEDAVLASYRALQEQNPDFAGWLQISDTRIDYPVMYTPEEPEKYLHLSFDGTVQAEGTPFIEAQCSLSPESDNLIVYGHNMKNGTMFTEILNYSNESFYQEHPRIRFDLVDDCRTYEVMAVFYDRVYYADEDVFKFYEFHDIKTVSGYQSGIRQLLDKSLYDTGVSATYGDRLLTLVTCSYHEENGRFVVVAKEIP